MTNLQYKILYYCRYKPRTVQQIVHRVNRFRFRKLKEPFIRRCIEALEDQYLIEDMGQKELEARKDEEEVTGVISDFTDTYTATEDNGVEVAEDEHEERRRFYAPFVFSTALAFLSLVVSIVALVRCP